MNKIFTFPLQRRNNTMVVDVDEKPILDVPGAVRESVEDFREFVESDGVFDCLTEEALMRFHAKVRSKIRAHPPPPPETEESYYFVEDVGLVG